MNRTNFFSTALIVLFFALLSCNGSNSTTPEVETPKVNPAQLTGHWQVTKAVRNGQETKTLDGLFFDFSETGTIKTNLLGGETESPFELSEGKIMQKGTNPLTYSVDELTDSQLVMNATIQGFDFALTLAKVKE